MPVADRRSPCAADRARGPGAIAVLGHHDRPRRRCARHRLDHREPVVGLVVEDPVGGRVAHVLPRRHQLAPMGCRRGSPRGRRPLPGTGERRARRRSARRQPQRRRPLPAHGGQRSATDLDERRGPTLDVGHLPPDRAAAVEAPHVLRALHAERHRAGGDGLAEAVHARVAGRVVDRSRARHDVRRPATRAARAPPSSADGGTNTSIGQSCDCGQRRRGDRRVAARGDGQRRALAPRRPGPSDSAARRCSRIVNR